MRPSAYYRVLTPFYVERIFRKCMIIHTRFPPRCGPITDADRLTVFVNTDVVSTWPYHSGQNINFIGNRFSPFGYSFCKTFTSKGPCPIE